MSYRNPKFIPNYESQAYDRMMKSIEGAGEKIAKKRADYAEEQKKLGEERAKAGNETQQSFINDAVKYNSVGSEYTRGVVDEFYDGWSQQIGDLKMATMGTDPKCAQEGFEFMGEKMTCDQAKNKLAVMAKSPKDMRTFIENLTDQLDWKSIKNFDPSQNPDLILASNIFGGKGEFTAENGYKYELVQSDGGSFDMVFYKDGEEVTRLNNRGLENTADSQGSLFVETASAAEIQNSILQDSSIIPNAEFNENGEFVSGQPDMTQFLPTLNMIDDPNNPGEQIQDPDQDFSEIYQQRSVMVEEGPPPVYGKVWVVQATPEAVLNNPKFNLAADQNLLQFVGDEENNMPPNYGSMKTYWNRVLRLKSDFSADTYDEDLAQTIWGEGDHQDKWEDSFANWDKDMEITPEQQKLFVEVFKRHQATLQASQINMMDPALRQVNRNALDQYPGFLEMADAQYDLDVAAAQALENKKKGILD